MGIPLGQQALKNVSVGLTGASDFDPMNNKLWNGYRVAV
jgi:hypothetical protein